MHICVFVYKKYHRIIYLDSMYPCGLLPKLFFQLSADKKKNNL